MPLLSPLRALAGSLSLATLYVGLLYALVPADVRAQPRDAPAHIAWRTLAVLVACALAPLVSAAAGGWRWGVDAPLREMGIDTSCWSAGAVAGPLLATALLFLGPLLQVGVAACTRPRALATTSRPPAWAHIAARNLLVSPLAEEWVFRCCVLPLWAATGAGPLTAAAATAAVFSAAHLHHALAHLRFYGSPAGALAAVAPQLLYTGLFGGLAAHALQATHAAPGVVLMHVLANALGPPELAWLDSRSAAWRVTVGGAYLLGMAGAAVAFPALAPSRGCA